ncbi:RING finger protein 32 [Thecamonas trahens ATCC 50062]|uniref:RING finger protein 32 n=1 Tax=Thecamonas trahens ATCC 50062 TaxID=461836 RepID=A0A0L0D5C1_THETB|nr:RING finger protein 32 [Thecamonas trahens ATCC 50062]KNC46513.1 RING finger protein 32 [Thecamonas trahens ATCC 50062]|eukprot:XP_013760294.1 RING finger protein 32 [Thecamonas trahens ATCC 50062]
MPPRELRLSLAQQLGLVAIPEGTHAGRAPEASEWDAARAAWRERGSDACAICLEPFAISAQVLLSCSHAFHETCLAAFEAHAAAQAAAPEAPVVAPPLACPLCRKTEYHKMRVTDAGRAYITAMVVRIQAWWRSVSQARKYKALRLAAPPPAHPTRRRAWLVDKLAATSDAMLAAVEATHSEADELCALIDAQLAAARSPHDPKPPPLPPSLSGTEWQAVYLRALDRGCDECTICLGSLADPQRPPTLLSCSHVFHAACIASFEAFTLEATPTCPICRAPFAKHAV